MTDMADTLRRTSTCGGRCSRVRGVRGVRGTYTVSVLMHLIRSVIRQLMHRMRVILHGHGTRPTDTVDTIRIPHALHGRHDSVATVQLPRHVATAEVDDHPGHFGGGLVFSGGDILTTMAVRYIYLTITTLGGVKTPLPQ